MLSFINFQKNDVGQKPQISMSDKKVLVHLAKLTHELQLERGISGLFVGSKGDYFGNRIIQQRKNTDSAIKQLKKNQIIQKNYSAKISHYLARFSDLEDVRYLTSTDNINLARIFNFYTHHLIYPLLQVMVEIAYFSPEFDHETISAFNSFIQWKERTGLERGIGSRGFIAESFQNEEFVERFLFLLSEQNSYQKTFFTLANTTQRQLVKNLLKANISLRLENIHEELKRTGLQKKLFKSFSPTEWFELISEKINLMHAIELELIENLASKSSDKPLPKKTKYHKIIASLQLFSGIAESTVSKIISQSKIIEFEKKSFIFREGEKAIFLYIVLKGWVKVFKSTEEGDEMILQMLSSGDSIMESIIFLSSVFTVNGQAVEDVAILAVPIEMLERDLTKTCRLAFNFISNMSNSSLHLIRQVQNYQLKSADEKIGRFLLKLHVENNFVDNTIKLPYKKNIVANYLGMSGETLSRGLKTLKQRGISIKGLNIILPTSYELCVYCDLEMAEYCSKYHKPECKFYPK